MAELRFLTSAIRENALWVRKTMNVTAWGAKDFSGQRRLSVEFTLLASVDSCWLGSAGFPDGFLALDNWRTTAQPCSHGGSRENGTENRNVLLSIWKDFAINNSNEAKRSDSGSKSSWSRSKAFISVTAKLYLCSSTFPLIYLANLWISTHLKARLGANSAAVFHCCRPITITADRTEEISLYSQFCLAQKSAKKNNKLSSFRVFPLSSSQRAILSTSLSFF